MIEKQDKDSIKLFHDDIEPSLKNIQFPNDLTTDPNLTCDLLEQVISSAKEKHLTPKKLNSIIINIRTRQIWGIWKLRPAYSPETPNLGQNRWCFVLCDFEIWWMTLENNRASLLCCFKLCATFHSHRWIQTGIPVWKHLIWVKFDYF